jgi:hypothetical protein
VALGVAVLVGSGVGVFVGRGVGVSVGSGVGVLVGRGVGVSVGVGVGVLVGFGVGVAVLVGRGVTVGSTVGISLSTGLGGTGVGDEVGVLVSSSVTTGAIVPGDGVLVAASCACTSDAVGIPCVSVATCGWYLRALAMTNVTHTSSSMMDTPQPESQTVRRRACSGVTDSCMPSLPHSAWLSRPCPARSTPMGPSPPSGYFQTRVQCIPKTFDTPHAAREPTSRTEVVLSERMVQSRSSISEESDLST